MSKQYPIGTIIEQRQDGSYIYMSHKGVINCDDWKDLNEMQKQDDDFIQLNPYYM